MRGLFFRNTGSLDNLKVAELPMPVPGAGEVLVQVLAAAINPSDAKGVLGKMAETTTPRVPGRDFAGRVVSGDPFWEGRAVFGTGGNLGFGRDGSHAEFVAVPVEGLVEMPPDLGYEQAAAMVLGYLTAFAGIVRTGAVQPGETVLVTGTTGSVGSAAARVAAWKGARVLGTVRSAQNLGKLKEDLPSVAWIDLESRPLPEAVKELTAGKGADLILDAVGGPLFEPCLESLAPRGRQVAIASAGDPRVAFNLVDFYHKEACLLGVDTLKLSSGEAAAILRALLPGFKEGIFAPPPVETVSLDDAVRAYQTVLAGTAGKKFVIRFG
ncbi:MAG: zinc-binding alcohol dehydrogenase family protein [Desulfobaccales bacterium]